MKRGIFLCLIIYTIADPSLASIQFTFEHVKKLDEKELELFKTASNVRGVYYYQRDLPRLRSLFKELDQSANYLDPYGVKIGVLDCTAHGQVKDCEKEKVEQNIYTYRDGYDLLNLELETMFDVNSIMSNMLQLVLLREVPILQTKDERLQFEDKHRGNHDIIFSYQKAIGTFDHRIFMEVAYAYQDQFKFALATSQTSSEGLQDASDITERGYDSAIWIIHCREEAKNCDSVRYRNKMDLAALAQYIRALTLPKTFDIPSDGLIAPYVANGMHIMYLYYDGPTKKGVLQVAEGLAEDVHGIVGLVTVDTEQTSTLQEHGGSGPLPSLSLKLKGEDKPLFMENDWKTESIRQFLYDNLYKKMYEEKPETGPNTMEEDAVPSSSGAGEQPASEYKLPNVEEVETQDDQVAEAVFRLRKTPMDLELVPALTDKSFPQTLKEKDLVFVLFFLPVDARSMAFLRAYGEASRELGTENGQPLAQVNCYHWTDVCAKQNITQYPTVHVYRKGQDLQVYKGILGKRAVVSAVKLLQAPQITDLSSEEEIDSFVTGAQPVGASNFTQVSVLGIFGEKHQKERDEYKQVAKSMHGQFLFGITTIPSVKEVAKKFGATLPGVVMTKRDDPYQPRVAYEGDFMQESIREFVVRSSIPVMPKLTASLFPLLHKKKQPFVVLFADSGDQSQTMKDIMGDVVTSRKFTDLIFTWMDVSNSTNIGASIMQEYRHDPEAQPPALSLVRLKTGAVYNYEDEGSTFDSITAWLSLVQSGDLTASTILPKGDWPPLHPGYNFLEMMDQEARGTRSVESDSSAIQAAEMHGIGFDTEGNLVGHETEEVSPKQQEQSEQELETRQELLERRNSRLHHSKDRKADHHAQGTDRKVEIKMEEEEGDVTAEKNGQTGKRDEL